MARRMMFGVIAIAVAALAAMVVASSVGASTVTEDDSSFTWSNAGADVAVTFGAAGQAPTSASLPTATYSGTVSTVTYQLIGTGVTLSTETLSTTVNNTSSTYTNYYYSVPNGVTYNKGASGQLANSSSTTGPSTATYQWRAVSYDSKYSEVDLDLTFNAEQAAITFEQTTSTFDLQIGNSDTHVMDAPVSIAGGPYTYRLLAGHYNLTLWKIKQDGKCDEVDSSLIEKCYRSLRGTPDYIEISFQEEAFITFDSSTLTFQMKSWLFDNPDYRASAIKEGWPEYGSYDFTVGVSDSAGNISHAFMTVNMLPSTLHFDPGYAVTASASRSEELDVTVSMPDGGVSQLFITTANKPWWWNISHDGFLNEAQIHVRDVNCNQYPTGSQQRIKCDADSAAYPGTHVVTFTVTDSSPTKQSVSTTVTVTITD